MRRSRCPALGWIAVAALTLGVLLAGCSASSTARTGRTVRTPTITPWPTVARATTPTAPTSSTIPEFAGCPPIGDMPIQPQYVSVGAVRVSVPARSPAHDYPSALMPSNAPNAPYQIAASAVNNYAPNPPVNPSLANGYELQICNATSAVHTLTSLSVNIANFTPSSGPVTVWHICGDGPYDAATKQTTPGCGGALGPSDFLEATLPSDSTGASAPARAKGQYGADLPLSIDPNEAIDLLVAVNGLTSQGTYTLSFGIGIDGAASTTLAPSGGSFLIAPLAVVWTGTACQSPAMQAQIPATSQDTYYVCPPAA